MGTRRADGHARSTLYAADAETVTVERLSAGARLAATTCAGGEEILVLDGTLSDEHGAYAAGTWIRNPAGFGRAYAAAHGATFWATRGHLRTAA